MKFSKNLYYSYVYFFREMTKNVNNKKCASKIIFFNEKKNEKDSNNF